MRWPSTSAHSTSASVTNCRRAGSVRRAASYSTVGHVFVATRTDAIGTSITGIGSRNSQAIPVLWPPPSETSRSPRGRLASMSDVTRILSAIETGDPHAAEQLLPLVYDELRKLAAQRLAQEAPGQTLQATALVHEAYLRLVGSGHREDWNGRGHFFAAAAEAM